MRSKYDASKAVMLSEVNSKKLYKQTKIEVIKLKMANELLEKKLEKRDNTILEMHNTIKRLEGMLCAYDNSNTPPFQETARF